MHIKSTDKYISINTDKFSFFLPQSLIDTVILYKVNDANIANLHVNTQEPIGNGFNWLNMSCEFALKIYSEIISQINNNDFIDLNCDGTRLFIRQSEIIGISCDNELNSPKKEIMLYRKNEASVSEYQLKQSEKDIKHLYNDLLAQISYTPRKNKSIESKQQGKINRSIWSQNQNNNKEMISLCNK